MQLSKHGVTGICGDKEKYLLNTSPKKNFTLKQKSLVEIAQKYEAQYAERYQEYVKVID